MNNTQIFNLAISLTKAESEEKVISILKEKNLWDESNWLEIDESKGNYSTIGNQQSTAEAALVEKIINSVDAVLMRECLIRNIDPTSIKAPKSIAEAQKEYFHIPNGKLSGLDTKVRSNLADNIYLLASGDKKSPSITVFDKGEGQSPSRFLNTFLSLNKGNKNNIQFVQGKFGMGGTGVLSFCSPQYNLQLIMSKRHIQIKNTNSIETNQHWGFTVIRRFNPTDLMRSSVYKYLAPNKEILSFSKDSIPLLDNKEVECGTYIKLYNYQLSTGRLRSDITRHLHNQLSLLMPDIALPITVVDKRYKKSPIKVLHGLSVRLNEDKRNKIELGFPSSGQMIIGGQEIEYSIYVFRPGQKKETYPKEGMVFSVNGQTQATEEKNFFERKNVDMGYLADSLLVVVDCSKIDRRTQEELFMTSRDRMRNGPLKKQILDSLAEDIKNHQGLKDLREKRKREEIKSKIDDSKSIQETLEKVVKNSPTLANLLIGGNRISNPFNFKGSSTQDLYHGKKFPTYFKLIKEYDKNNPKNCPINRKFRIKYETDVENEYLTRDSEPGNFILNIEGLPAKDCKLNFWNGIGTLTVKIPTDLVKIGDVIKYQGFLSDLSLSEPFESDFYIKVGPEEEKQKGISGKRIKPPTDENGSDRQLPSSLDLPQIEEVYQDNWNRHDFNEYSALKVSDLGENNGYCFFINMENLSLLREIKSNLKIDSAIIKDRYKIGMLFLGMSLLEKYNKNQSLEEGLNENFSVFEQIKTISSAFSPYLLPMISTFSDIS